VINHWDYDSVGRVASKELLLRHPISNCHRDNPRRHTGRTGQVDAQGAQGAFVFVQLLVRLRLN
jgi:hypothetical protein